MTGNGRPLCGARRNRVPDLCRRPAGWGTDHAGVGRCKLHGGASPNGRVHAARQVAAIEAAKLGAAVPVDPHEALMTVVHTVNGGVEYLRRRVLELEDVEVLDGESGQLHPTARAFVAELDRLARVAKTATDAGVEERRMRLDEQRADLVTAFLRAFVDDLDLSDEQRRALPGVMARHLPILNGTARPALEAA
jgi:hypothetical protein